MPADFTGPDSDPSSEAWDELDRLQAECGGGQAWNVAIFRKPPDSAKFLYCRKLPLTGFNLDKLPELFGGGEFLLRVLDHRNKIRKAISIAFDPSIHPVEPARSPAASAATLDPTMAGLVLRMQQQLDESSKDQKRFLETLVTALMGAKGTSPAPTLTEMVNAQIALRELTKTESPKEDAILTALKIGLSARGEVGGAGEEEGGDPLYRVIEKVAVPLIEALKTRPAAPAPRAVIAKDNPPGGGPQRPPGPGAPGAASPPAAGIPSELQGYAWLRKYADYLIGWARSNFDPRRVASVIYNVVPDEQLPILEEFLSRSSGERFSILVQLDPRLQPYESYLDQVAEATLGEIALDSAADDEAEPGAGGTESTH